LNKKKKVKMMHIDLQPYPTGQPNREQAERVVVVIDVLRATSTIVTALANGAAEVIPMSDASEASLLARRLGEDQCLTGGERGGLPIPGLNLGNSPLEYGAAVVKGKKVALCTTNGTQAIRWAQPAKKVLIASFLNLPAVVAQLQKENSDVLLLCSGRKGALALEDMYCAGMIAHSLSTALFGPGLALSDATWLSLIAFTSVNAQDGLQTALLKTDHGQYLCELGFQADVEYCSRVGIIDHVPVYTGGRIILPEAM